MGLDISYYSKIVPSTSAMYEDLNTDVYPIYEQPGFEYQLGSLKEFQEFSLSDETDCDSFRAGSYGGYNGWRRNLAIMAGYNSDSEVWYDWENELERVKITGDKMKPFYELINFSDCEGVICSEISKKLYDDFLAFDEKAKVYSVDNEYGGFYNLYQQWKECFRVASDY